jgi:hypothetical protein
MAAMKFVAAHDSKNTVEDIKVAPKMVAGIELRAMQRTVEGIKIGPKSQRMAARVVLS